LVERALIGDEASRDQHLASLVELGGRLGQALAQGRVRVVTETLGIRHGDQKEIEGTGGIAELIDMALTDQALIDSTELLGDASEFGWRNETFVHPGYLLGDGVDHTEYRAPILAAGGRSWQCSLVTLLR